MFPTWGVVGMAGWLCGSVGRVVGLVSCGWGCWCWCSGWGWWCRRGRSAMTVRGRRRRSRRRRRRCVGRVSCSIRGRLFVRGPSSRCLRRCVVWVCGSVIGVVCRVGWITVRWCRSGRVGRASCGMWGRRWVGCGVARSPRRAPRPPRLWRIAGRRGCRRVVVTARRCPAPRPSRRFGIVRRGAPGRTVATPNTWPPRSPRRRSSTAHRGARRRRARTRRRCPVPRPVRRCGCVRRGACRRRVAIRSLRRSRRRWFMSGRCRWVIRARRVGRCRVRSAAGG